MLLCLLLAAIAPVRALRPAPAPLCARLDRTTASFPQTIVPAHEYSKLPDPSEAAARPAACRPQPPAAPTAATAQAGPPCKITQVAGPPNPLGISKTTYLCCPVRTASPSTSAALRAQPRRSCMSLPLPRPPPAPRTGKHTPGTAPSAMTGLRTASPTQASRLCANQTAAACLMSATATHGGGQPGGHNNWGRRHNETAACLHAAPLFQSKAPGNTGRNTKQPPVTTHAWGLLPGAQQVLPRGGASKSNTRPPHAHCNSALTSDDRTEDSRKPTERGWPPLATCGQPLPSAGRHTTGGQPPCTLPPGGPTELVGSNAAASAAATHGIPPIHNACTHQPQSNLLHPAATTNLAPLPAGPPTPLLMLSSPNRPGQPSTAPSMLVQTLSNPSQARWHCTRLMRPPAVSALLAAITGRQWGKLDGPAARMAQPVNYTAANGCATAQKFCASRRRRMSA